MFACSNFSQLTAVEPSSRNSALKPVTPGGAASALPARVKARAILRIKEKRISFMWIFHIIVAVFASFANSHYSALCRNTRCSPERRINTPIKAVMLISANIVANSFVRNG